MPRKSGSTPKRSGGGKQDGAVHRSLSNAELWNASKSGSPETRVRFPSPAQISQNTNKIRHFMQHARRFGSKNRNKFRNNVFAISPWIDGIVFILNGLTMSFALPPPGMAAIRGGNLCRSSGKPSCHRRLLERQFACMDGGRWSIRFLWPFQSIAHKRTAVVDTRTQLL